MGQVSTIGCHLPPKLTKFVTLTKRLQAPSQKMAEVRVGTDRDRMTEEEREGEITQHDRDRPLPARPRVVRPVRDSPPQISGTQYQGEDDASLGNGTWNFITAVGRKHSESNER